MLDGDTLFDQQTSVLLEQSQRRTPAAPLRINDLSATASSVLDNIAGRINSLEDRLNACDSIYRLAAQANSLREKDRREKYQSFMQHAAALEQRVNKVENKVKQIPQIIRELVTEEMKKYDNTKQINTLMTTETARMEDRIAELDRKYAEINKKTQKSLKKLKVEAQLAQSHPDDDGKADELSQQIAELKRRQNLMVDLLSAIRSRNDQDFDGVNSQLTGLWSQLALKRGSESPLRQTK